VADETDAPRAGGGFLAAAATGALTTVIVALIAAAGAAGADWFSFASKDEEVRAHLIEIAIGILRADPKDGVAPARGWSIKVIEKNSGVDFSPEEKKDLLVKPLDALAAYTWKGEPLEVDPHYFEKNSRNISTNRTPSRPQSRSWGSGQQR